MKRVLFALLATAIGILLLEGLLSFLWMAPDYAQSRASAARAVTLREDFHAQHDPDLGWSHIPGKHVEDIYGPGRSITINRDGFRGPVDYVGQKPQDRFRVVCLGDSFTLGYGVDDPATYPAQLERFNPGVQAVNMGQGAYSVGQCYLWFQRDGGRLEADALVAMFILDDIWRMTQGRMANGAAMPRFELAAGRLHVGGQPLPEKIAAGEPLDDGGGLLGFLFERSALFRTVGLAVRPVRAAHDTPDYEQQLRVATVIIGELYRDASEKNVPMVLVLMPELIELQDPARREQYQRVAGGILEIARAGGIPAFDLFPDLLAAENAAELFIDDAWHHPNELGQRLIAERVDAILTDSVPGYPARSASAADAP